MSKTSLILRFRTGKNHRLLHQRALRGKNDQKNKVSCHLYQVYLNNHQQTVCLNCLSPTQTTGTSFSKSAVLVWYSDSYFLGLTRVSVNKTADDVPGETMRAAPFSQIKHQTGENASRLDTDTVTAPGWPGLQKFSHHMQQVYSGAENEILFLSNKTAKILRP